MNLDEQLRAALTLEAEMAIAPPPDADVLISGGQARRRRRNVRRLSLVAAAVVLIGGGVYTVTQVDAGNADTGPATNPTPTSETTTAVSGSREQVGVDLASGQAISVVVPESATLFGGGTGVTSKDDRTGFVGLDVLQARTLAGGASACADDTWAARGRQPATTPSALARQLARLPGSTVTQPVTSTTAFGYDAVHLRLRVNNGCPAGSGPYLVAEADSDFGLGYGDRPTDVVIDFLVVDVRGTPIVAALWNQVDASSALVQRAARVRDSIAFVTGT